MRCSKTTGSVLLILGIVVVRLPLLFSPTLIPDIDEAALAIQVQKWLEGIPVQSFFPGQIHNWVGLEMLIVAPWLMLFPPSVYALKLPVLLIFSASVLLLFHVATKRLRPLPLVLLMLGVTSLPPLLIWSMKLRGGYIPAFFFMSLAMFILSRKRVWPIHMLFFGASLSLMIQSHLLCGVFAIVPISTLLKRNYLNPYHIIFASFGVIIGWMITLIGKTPKLLFPADTDRFADSFAVFSAPIIHDFWQFLSGQFLFWQTPSPSLIFLVVPLLLTALIIKMMVGPQRIQMALLILGVIVFYWLFQPFPLRYGVPFLLALLAMVASSPPNIRGQWLVIPTAYIILIPFITPFLHSHLHSKESTRTENQIREWVKRDAEYATVFCEDEALAYILNFYGETHYRAKPAYSRFQRDWYDAEHALQSNDAVGLISQRPVINDMIGSPIGLSFYFYDALDHSDLKKLGFELKE